MAGEGRFHCDVGRFVVTDFTDHHHVRGLAENGAQRSGEVQAYVAVHLHLIYAGHLVFDRVLDGDDLAVGRVHLAEAGIERSGFSGAGWPGHEKHAVAEAKQLLELLLVVGEEAEFRQAECEVLLVENTHDDGLAMVGRNRRDTEVEVAPLRVHLDAAVLRDALLGNLHARLNLDSLDDRGLEALRRRVHVLEGAVDAVADAEAVLKRLQMDIGGAALEGFHDDQ